MAREKLRKILLKTIIFFLTIVILALAYSYFSNGIVYELFQEDPEILINELSAFGKNSYFIFVLLIILESIFAPFPPLIIYMAGGAIFGGFLAGVLALLGNFIGAGIAFFISRKFARNWVKKQVPDKFFDRIDKFSEGKGPIAIFLLRINPLTSSDLFSYAAGLTKMNFKHFLFWTTLALIPTIFIQTYLGEKITAHPLLNKIFFIGGALYLIGVFVFYLIMKSKKID